MVVVVMVKAMYYTWVVAMLMSAMFVLCVGGGDVCTIRG